MNPRSVIHTVPVLLSLALACGSEVGGRTIPSSGHQALNADGLVISSPLALDKTIVVAGDTLHGTVTWQNTSATPISIQFAVISGRRPGGTNVGGPYDDLLPKLTSLQTIQPGATLTLSAARTFTSADPLGAWYSYATYQDAGGAWHDGPNVNFTVGQPNPLAGW